MEYTLQEERLAKVQVEEKLLQLKKDHSMLDCDYKLAQNKLDELQAQKEKLCEEVALRLTSIYPPFRRQQPERRPLTLSSPSAV